MGTVVLPNRYDVVVLGAGPSGWLIARACAARSLRVAVVAPNPDAPWAPTYGMWADEAEAAGFDRDVAVRWSGVDTVGFTGRLTSADVPYVRMDGASLQRRLRAECAALGVETLIGRAVGLRHHRRGTLVSLRDLPEVDTALVVDASGHAPMFVEREPDGGAAQMAWGIEIEADLPFSTDRMRWMDFSPTHGEADGPSTFLYAMPLGERRWFLEETSLSSDPPVPMVVLERRLRARLRALGVGSPQVLSEERCRIPMEPGLPARGQRVVGFGAAASVVHPATGYVLASAALMADPVAAAIEQGLWRDPDQAARDAWHAVWPDEARRAHTLLRFAARFMRELDAPRTAAFFEQFFQLPPERWRRFLSARPRTAELVPVMASVFSGVDADLRWRMLRAGSGSSALPILRSVAGL